MTQAIYDQARSKAAGRADRSMVGCRPHTHSLDRQCWVRRLSESQGLGCRVEPRVTQSALNLGERAAPMGSAS
jgi:hypothetical protein